MAGKSYTAENEMEHRVQPANHSRPGCPSFCSPD